jgi:predicted transcriptional regulator
MMYDTYIMRRTQIYLDDDQNARLDRRAAAANVTKSHLIREAVASYLAASDDDADAAAFRAAVDALRARPTSLEDGASYVERIRAADAERQRDLEERGR